MVFSWRTVSADFQANCLGNCGNSLSLCLQSIVAWRNWVEKLVFWTVLIYLFYLFIHSFIYDLYIYFLLFINLLLGSCLSGHSSTLLAGRGGGGGGGGGGGWGSNFIKLCKDSSGPFCSLVHLLQDVTTSLLSFFTVFSFVLITVYSY